MLLVFALVQHLAFETGLKRFHGTTFWSLLFNILLEKLANLKVRPVSVLDAVHFFWREIFQSRPSLFDCKY